MKRLWISIVILAVTVVMCTASVMIIKHSNEVLFEHIHSTEEAYRQGGDAKKELGELMEYWERHYVTLTFLTGSTAMEDIERTAARLPYLLEAGSDDFLAELKGLESWAQLVYDRSVPDLTSIF